MGIMTTQTINTFYCAFCAWVSKKANSLWAKTTYTLKYVGTARAASQLASAGYHEAAKSLMMDLKTMEQERWGK